MLPAIDAIDHIHHYVDDKPSAAAWFQAELGFDVIDELRVWDTKQGPLTIGRGDVHIALFARTDISPASAIAFRCSGADFGDWFRRLKDRALLERCVDHGLAWSLYFRDPWQHMHEITSYDVETIRQLERSNVIEVLGA